MRLGLTLTVVVWLCVLGLISAMHGPAAIIWFLPRPSAVLTGALIFFSCVAGMLIVHIHLSYARADARASRLSEANADLELLVDERTRSLSEKVIELEHARCEAVEANTAKSRFLATMSHELRTPLNAIIGFSEMIEREMFGPAGDKRYVEYAGHVHQSGAHLLSLIGDILDLSKIEAGKMELHCEQIAVGDLIESARRLSRADASHQVTVLLEDGLPMLQADRRAALQMIMNLLSNAVKFTPKGGAIAATAIARADGGVTLAVRDSGIGIATADIPRALAVYSQVSNPETRRHAGTGLGLPIVAALMKLHGGSLELESEVGVGTSVSLHFPAVRSLCAAA
ncbi:MAG: hypothetical protein KBA31_09125 [Alphaproteobacteria bacterium]|nr:hypothetical protein [Alphaproteobacteria bacterium]